MNDDTPARLIKVNDLNANSVALAELINGIDPPSSVLDIRYGLGGWARVVAETFPESCIIGYEHDPITARAAWIGSRVTLRVKAFDPNEIEQPVDLLLADFNTTTAKKRTLLDDALRIRPLGLIFTDVACSKLHLNFSSYGLSRPSLIEYWRRFDVPGYQLIGYVKAHHAASTALYKRVDV